MAPEGGSSVGIGSGGSIGCREGAGVRRRDRARRCCHGMDGDRALYGEVLAFLSATVRARHRLAPPAWTTLVCCDAAMGQHGAWRIAQTYLYMGRSSPCTRQEDVGSMSIRDYGSTRCQPMLQKDGMRERASFCDRPRLGVAGDRDAAAGPFWPSRAATRH